MENKRLEDYILYSGGAEGADKYWAEEASKLDITVKNYTVNDYKLLTPEGAKLVEENYLMVARSLKRPVISAETYAGMLVRRNIMIGLKSTSVFSIGTVVYKGEIDSFGKKWTEKYTVMNGGSAYTTELGRIKGIPVYVYDLEDDEWLELRGDETFVVNEGTQGIKENSFKSVIPKPTLSFAGIGTRKLNDSAKEAISSVINTLVTD